jgi:hypothetical protein
MSAASRRASAYAALITGSTDLRLRRCFGSGRSKLACSFTRSDLSPRCARPAGPLCTSVQPGAGHTSPFDRTKRALHFRTSRGTRHICPTTYGPHRGPRAQVTRSDAQLLLLATAAMMSWADSRSSRAGGFPQRHCVRFCSTLVLRPRDRPQREARYVCLTVRKTLLRSESSRLQSVVNLC